MTASDVEFTVTGRPRRLPSARFVRSITAITVAASLAVFATPVFGQVPQGDRSISEALFQEGKRLMAEGKYADACPKLAESQRIDPGAGTLTALALCHRGAGKTASAWGEFKEVVSVARRDGRTDREQVALENIAELEPKLSRLRIVVDPAAEAQHIEVRIDEGVVTHAAFGQALPVDPGVRRVLATAPGKKPFEATVTIGLERDEQTVRIGRLEEDTRASGAMDERGQAPTEAPRGTSTQKYWGYGVGAVGLVGLGIGTVFGVRALSKNDESDTKCPTTPCSDPAGVQASKDAGSAANVANVAIGVGAAAVIGGLVLILTSPSTTTANAAPRSRAHATPPSKRSVWPTAMGLSGTF